jgi:methanethiol S-methyltransferase
MKRILVFTYGLTCYVMFLAVYAYAAGFVGNIAVPKSIDSPAQGPLGVALAVNLALLAVFAVQHSVMARPAFKRWWTRFVPVSMERSTYMLFSNLAIVLLFWQWRPIGGVIWDVENPTARAMLYGVFTAGWLGVPAVSLFINHFDLFGLRQVWLYLRGKPYTHLPFMTPGPYRWVRHPLYIAWFTAFWVTPTMTAAHLFFALGTTAYILIAIRFEERDLVAFHGEHYARYRRNVPMLVPGLTPNVKEEAEPAAA